MGYSKSSIGKLAMVSLLFLGVAFVIILIWSPSFSNVLHSFPLHNSCSLSNKITLNVSKDDLETALEEASAENKTLIIAVVNKAYVEGEGRTMLDLFMESFWLGEGTRPLIDHLLLVAVDQIAFDRCKFLRLHCYKLVTEGVDFGGEKFFMSDDFLKMMWRRTLFLADVLKRGYSFIFTDTDVMWLRNPFLRLSNDNSSDLQISCDKFNGNQWSEANPINTGFYYVRSNNKTIALFDAWYAMKNRSQGMNDQGVLERMKRRGEFRRLGLRVRYMDTVYFSGFCRESRDIRAVTTVHANCCRSINAKLADLTVVLRDWRKFMSSSNQTLNFHWSTHMACRRSW
ncbi:PREDICTED: uncharacterized protein At1g28695-like [Nelumbo nucifera]|uniref:Nucleotide-diphospho-sugar transferase domain-containing protein n=2 Tax=Nelumbo nucifera TaxID=4432 RepID=A0A823A0C0_NELNU|nr:PREDICTED: uncharacterized protein At1g28695-like [Nelumbo nucifera]DAD47628.1 TPA_asm: hypothetical protein HUJ06_017565 [Nelumbo nucifera]